MAEFYLTQMGHKFYGADVPAIAKALKNIAEKEDLSRISTALEGIREELQEQNELKRKELELKEKELEILNYRI